MADSRNSVGGGGAASGSAQQTAHAGFGGVRHAIPAQYGPSLEEIRGDRGGGQVGREGRGGAQKAQGAGGRGSRRPGWGGVRGRGRGWRGGHGGRRGHGGRGGMAGGAPGASQGPGGPVVSVGQGHAGVVGGASGPGGDFLAAAPQGGSGAIGHPAVAGSSVASVTQTESGLVRPARGSNKVDLALKECLPEGMTPLPESQVRRDFDGFHAPVGLQDRNNPFYLNVATYRSGQMTFQGDPKWIKGSSSGDAFIEREGLDSVLDGVRVTYTKVSLARLMRHQHRRLTEEDDPKSPVLQGTEQSAADFEEMLVEEELSFSDRTNARHHPYRRSRAGYGGRSGRGGRGSGGLSDQTTDDAVAKLNAELDEYKATAERHEEDEEMDYEDPDEHHMQL
ncbi:hypothetical protein F5Y05DRAFT_392339 [Hypoxylon sp. FL0543]|nr:hypothetical protein F5Y05DRAFT_392339 [Hypoxylon sp. FL0543]